MFWRHFQETLRKERVFAKHRQTSSNPIASFQLLLLLFPHKLSLSRYSAGLTVAEVPWLFCSRSLSCVEKGWVGWPFPLLRSPKATCALAAVYDLFSSAGSRIGEPDRGTGSGSRSSWKSAFPHPALLCASQQCSTAMAGWAQGEERVGICDQLNNRGVGVFTTAPTPRWLNPSYHSDLNLRVVWWYQSHSRTVPRHMVIKQSACRHWTQRRSFSFRRPYKLILSLNILFLWCQQQTFLSEGKIHSSKSVYHMRNHFNMWHITMHTDAR